MSVVLLIRDDKLLRRALRASLHAWNFDVLDADSGDRTLTLVANGGPDLVILDSTLPGIDGIDTLRHLCSSTEAPVLVLTLRDSLDGTITAFDVLIANRGKLVTRERLLGTIWNRTSAAIGAIPPQGRRVLQDFARLASE